MKFLRFSKNGQLRMAVAHMFSDPEPIAELPLDLV